MLAGFTKREGKIYGLLIREWIESLADGKYCIEIERIDGEKRSGPANRLYWGAICKALSDWSFSEGGKGLSQDSFHKFFKDTCLPVILDQRPKIKKYRVTLPSGVVMYENRKPELSTTILTTAEFTRYIELCCEVAKLPREAKGLGYPYDLLQA